MSITLLEPPDTTESGQPPEQSNVGPAQGDAGNTASPDAGGAEQQPDLHSEAGGGQPEGGAEGSQQQQPEPTVKVGDREVPLSVAQKALQDFENDQAWKTRNKQESEELNARRERVKRAEILDSMLEKRPEIVQQLFAPTPKRDFDAEIAAHHSTRPDAYDSTALSAWEIKRDQLLSEKQTAQVEARIEAVRSREDARLYNERIETTAREKFVTTGKKLDDNEFQRMTDWVIERRQFDPATGKAFADSYDLAYRALYPERYEREVAEAAVRRATAPMRKATTGGADAGITQRTAMPSESQRDEDEFIRRTREQSGGKWQKL